MIPFSAATEFSLFLKLLYSVELISLHICKHNWRTVFLHLEQYVWKYFMKSSWAFYESWITAMILVYLTSITSNVFCFCRSKTGRSLFTVGGGCWSDHWDHHTPLCDRCCLVSISVSFPDVCVNQMCVIQAWTLMWPKSTVGWKTEGDRGFTFKSSKLWNNLLLCIYWYCNIKYLCLYFLDHF